jgi:hypothetical protein
MANSLLQVPPSYKQFVETFGNSKLYRHSRNGYVIGVFAAPRETTAKDGTPIYHLGWHNGASVYLKPKPDSAQLPIFEFEEVEETVGATFEGWLAQACGRARSSFGKRKWAEILRGPQAFTEAEKAVVESRRLFEWKVVGLDSAGNHIFEVKNASQRTLPVLTLGIRSKDGRLNGAVRLDTRHIPSGQRALVHMDCYKDLVPAKEIEVFGLPDPQPEDREYYQEFRESPAG